MTLRLALPIAFACLCPLTLTLAACGNADAAPTASSPAAAAGAPAYEPSPREAPEEAAVGDYAGLGNGVEVAVLARLQAPAGTKNIGAGRRGEAWRVRVRNAASEPRPFPGDFFAFEFGGEAAGPDKFQALEAGAKDHLEDARGEAMPRLGSILLRLMPGQAVDGWLFPEVPEDAAAGEAALLMTSFNPLIGVQPGSVLVRLPAAPGEEAEADAVPALPEPLAPDAAFTGEATTVRLLKAEVMPVERGYDHHEVEVEVELTNDLDREFSQFLNGSNPTRCFFLIDPAGRLWSHGHGKSFRGLPMKLPPGESATTLITFRVPDGATGLRLLVDGSLGLSGRKKDGEREKIQAAPFATWAIN